MKKSSLVLVLLMLTVLLVSACSNTNDESSDSESNSGSSAKKYIIATDTTYPPFEFEQDGKYVGIDIDVLEAIAKEEGFEYELRPMDFKGIIPALTSNQIDAAMSGMTITDERRKSVDFSEGYYESGTSVIVRADDDSIKSEEDFKGKVFAVKKGTVGAIYAEGIADKYNAQIKYFDDTPSTFQEVANGNADICIEDYPVITYMLKVNNEYNLRVAIDKVSSEFYGFAVNKGKNSDLLSKFNEGLAKIQENGVYDEIVNKYLGE